MREVRSARDENIIEPEHGFDFLGKFLNNPLTVTIGLFILFEEPELSGELLNLLMILELIPHLILLLMTQLYILNIEFQGHNTRLHINLLIVEFGQLALLPHNQINVLHESGLVAELALQLGEEVLVVGGRGPVLRFLVQQA